MFVDTRGLGAGPISPESPSGSRSRTTRSSICGFPSWVAGAHRVLVHRTRHGAAQLSEATPTIWQPRPLPMDWPDW